MGARSVSPGAALLRSSRMFSVPKPLPEPQQTNLVAGGDKSATMTRPYPMSQSITSPLSSREKGDWGFKRPFPLKSTMATSTPLIRVKQVDSVENVTDFMSAADYTISLEKFQELRVALSVPRSYDSKNPSQKSSLWLSSVFEQRHDFTYLGQTQKEERPMRKGKDFSKEKLKDPDAWFKSIFEECTSLTYPKPAKQQAVPRQGTTTANLRRAPAQRSSGITSANPGVALWQTEGEATSEATHPADQHNGVPRDALGSAVPRDTPQQEGMREGGTGASPQKAHDTHAAAGQTHHGADEQDGLYKRRWKFQGPWLARMTQGEFNKFLEKQVRPRRAEFRLLLMDKLAKELTSSQNSEALERGMPPPPPVEPKDITKEQFTEFLRTMRYDRILLYDLISKFLDMAPLGHPLSGVMMSVQSKQSPDDESPYGKSGPPSCHPSAGISYLRTGAFMENHPIYGPQSHRAPILARVVSPRIGAAPAKLGVGGFVAITPTGDNEFNMRHGRQRSTNKTMLAGISYLDTTTYGGAKAYVEPYTASVDPSRKVVLQLRETRAEASVIAKESIGSSTIYDDHVLDRFVPGDTPTRPTIGSVGNRVQVERMADRIMDQVLPQGAQNQSGADRSQTPRV